MSTDVGVWIAAILTLFIYSFLYRDNVLYKIAEHLVVGVSVGYTIVIYYFNYIESYLIQPLRNPEESMAYKVILIVPIILGVFMLTRLIPRISWMSRFSIAFYMGGYAGMSIPPTTQARIIQQMKSTMIPLNTFSFETLNNLLLIAGVLATLTYFFFSIKHRGAIGKFTRLGIIYLMVGFGASFGYTVMARISLLIGRLQFLLGEWIHLIP
jgi:hypothetical protein